MDFSKPDSTKSVEVFERFHASASDALNQLHFIREDIIGVANQLATASCIYALGVGKMSYIAGKFAASLRSIGVEAHFLDATHLAHGDLGVVCKGALVVIFSKSGNSSELKAVAPYLKSHAKSLVLVTAQQQSPLAEFADKIISLPFTEEGDTFNLLPLSSTLLAMAIGDAIVALVADFVKFSPDGFASFHPAGQIGLNLNRCVSDLTKWKTRQPFLPPDASCAQAMEAIGKALCGLACILNHEGELIAIVSDGDIRRALVNNKIGITDPVKSIWNTRPATVGVSSNLRDVYDLMEGQTKKLYALPVLEGKKCLGIMNIHDLF